MSYAQTRRATLLANLHLAQLPTDIDLFHHMISASNLLNLARASVIATAVVLLSACGQKGPLVHPDKDADKFKSAAAKPAPATPKGSAPSGAAAVSAPASASGAVLQ